MCISLYPDQDEPAVNGTAYVLGRTMHVFLITS